MTPLDLAWLEAGARRLRWRLLLATTALGVAVGLVTLAATLWLTGRLPSALAAGLGLGLLAWFAAPMRPRGAITARALARHLNRTTPELEESAELLLGDANAMSGLALLQRRRLDEQMRAMTVAPSLPDAGQRLALRVAAGLGLVAAVLLLLPRGTSAEGPRAGSGGGAVDTVTTGGEALSIRLVAVRVAPPTYTGLPARTGDGWELEVEEGATITWELEASIPLATGWLTTSAGDTVPLAPDRGRLRASLTAVRSTLYRIHLDQAGGPPVGFQDHRLGVIADTPPLLTVIRPEPRTLVYPGDPLILDVEALARDDHGVDAAAIVATVSKGQGEGVKFREQRLDFTMRVPREGGGLVLRRTLDLMQLGLEPGDELYFHLVATDRRTPLPNEGRSETIFVTLVDTTRAVTGPGTGVALDVAPDYFRSQRQLIIDTEKLLADQPGLARQVFMDRSNGLGIDQGLLRLRYGQFMGDEFEGEIPASGRQAHADDHADAPVVAPPAGAPAALPGEPTEDLLTALTHDHDDPENATLLAPQVKAKLREAITAMWSAELHLRLGEPRRSLPFQHRALELLQEIRRDARAYVQRVGFEPPPLEPDQKRLTGRLDEVRPPAVIRSAAWRDGEPALREGLRRLRRLAADGPAEPDDARALEALGQAMAERAVADAAWLLEPLRALREGIASLPEGGRHCARCFDDAAAGVLRALGEVGPAATATRRAPTGLAERYRARLQDPR